MAREPKSTSVSDVISALENLSAVDLGKVIKAAQEQLEAKRESGKKELLEEVRSKAEALGISLEELYKLTDPDVILGLWTAALAKQTAE